MIGWLGDAYPWIKSAHIIFVIFWMAGMFMLPRFLVYHYGVAPGSAEDGLWIARENRLRFIIINPAMLFTWGFGLMLLTHLGVGRETWFILKFLIVLGLSGYHGWLVSLTKAFAAGRRPISEKRLRLANEVPGLAIILIVILVIVRPF